MPDTLYISKAGSLGWKYNQDSGSIHGNSQNLDGNYLLSEIQDYYNCSGIEVKRDAQLFNCTDTTKVQFEYSRADYDPMVVVYDSSGLPIKVINETDMLNTSSVYGFELDFSDPEFPCDECISLKLWSKDVVAPIANLFTDGENGTMEGVPGITNMNTGPGNGKVQSNAQAQSGLDSMRVTSGLVPTLADRMIAYGATPLNLTAGNIYQADAYVWNDVAVPFVNGQDIFIDIAGSQSQAGPDYFTDATIINETRYNYGIDGTGAWIRISTTFQVNTDTTGNIAIVSVKVPEAVGIIYVDTITLRLVTNHLEATSEPIHLATNHPCSMLIEYGAIEGREHEQFGLFYEESPGDFYQWFNSVRLRIRNMYFNMVDDDYTTQDTSVGGSEVVVSRLVKQYVLHTDQQPLWMLEKLPMIMKHDNVRFYFDGRYVEMICLTKTFNPAYPDGRTAIGSMEFLMRPKEYDYMNSNCS